MGKEKGTCPLFLLTPAASTRSKRARSQRKMPVSKTVRFAYAFAFAMPLALANPVSAAQARKPAEQAPAPVAQRDAVQRDLPPTTVSTLDADETRRQLEDVLRAYPSTLPRILRMDPTLLTNADYLQPYPALSNFLALHPEIKHNPAYFLSSYNVGDFGYRAQTPQDRAVDMWRNTIEGFQIGTLILAIAGGLIWLIKTLVDQRRWSRLSKIQTDVHTKILDRFASNEDLLAYIQTPAGRKFLESAPISIDQPRSIAAPLGRILWSAQAGAVLTVLGLGIILVSRNALEEVAPPLAAFGAVLLALGVGVLVSAFLAYTLTRRFKLMPDQSETAAPESRG